MSVSFKDSSTGDGRVGPRGGRLQPNAEHGSCSNRREYQCIDIRCN